MLLFAFDSAQCQGEEKLRVIYDKKYNQQKVLDDKGAEYSKIDDIHVSLRRLLSKINVAVTAVDVISRRIHRLRDEDLLAQLKELIEGYEIVNHFTFLFPSYPVFLPYLFFFLKGYLLFINE